MRKRLLMTAVGMAALGAFAASPLSAQNPYARANDTWINIEGTVTDVSPDRFLLDYGPGEITVEMDDGDRDADAYALMPGDTVSVSGMIDDDLFETRTIEASRVYVANLGTSFQSSAVDEEDFYVPAMPLEVSRTTLRGTVTEVGDDAFTLNTGVRAVTVETDDMAYDPLDDEGYQKIEPGDRVSVIGTMDYDFFSGNELVADLVITLEDHDSMTS